MHRPTELATQLGISPATLRLWSKHFAELLSPSAQGATTEQGTPSQRRYTDDDVRLLVTAQRILGEGNTTYEMVKERLKTEPLAEDLPIEETAVVPVSQPDGGSSLAQYVAEQAETNRLLRELVTIERERNEYLGKLAVRVADEVTVLEGRLNGVVQTMATQQGRTDLPRFRWDFLNRLLEKSVDDR